jgi:glycosyl transferase family 1
VFPSRWENWPNVCLEAMSQGAVVVGSVHGGMSEMIEPGESGYVVDPFDAEAMCRTIEDIIRRPEAHHRMREQAQSRAASLCDYATCADAIVDSYQVDAAPRRFAVCADVGHPEFVLAAQAGVELGPDCLSQAVSALANNPRLGCVACPVQRPGHTEGDRRPLGLVSETLPLWNTADNGCCVWRRATLDELGADDTAASELTRWEMLCRLARTDWEHDVLPEPVAEAGDASPAVSPADRIAFAQRLAIEHPVSPEAIDRTLSLLLAMWIEESDGRAWFMQQASNWERIAAEHEQTIGELRAWIGKLDEAKVWLDGQRSHWQAQAEAAQARVAELTDELAQGKQRPV